MVSLRRPGRPKAGLAVALFLALAFGGIAVAPSPRPANPEIEDRTAGPVVGTGKAVRVRDGDSIVVLAGGREIEVRLHGVDAPELGQAYGKRAKRRTGDMVFGKQVRLEPRGTDAYGRELAEVFLPDGRSLNRELVSEGFAWWYRRYADDADLAAREGEARAAHRGLWADPAPVPPWEWREAHPRAEGGR